MGETVAERDVVEYLATKSSLADMLDALAERCIPLYRVIAGHELRLERILTAENLWIEDADEPVQLEERVLERGCRQQELSRGPDRIDDSLGGLRAFVDAAEPVSFVDDDEVPFDALNKLALRVDELVRADDDPVLDEERIRDAL